MAGYTNKKFRYTWTADNGTMYRLQITAAQDWVIGAGAFGWGATVDIPAGAISIKSTGKTEFPGPIKIPIGLCEMSAMTFAVHLGQLGGSADLRALRSALLDPEHGTVDIDYGRSLTITHNTRNRWYVERSTDAGSTWSEFFDGAQRAQTGQTFTLHDGTTPAAYAVIEVTIANSLRMAFEDVRMSYAVENAWDYILQAASDDPDAIPHRGITYDLIYKASGGLSEVMAVAQGAGFADDDNAGKRDAWYALESSLWSRMLERARELWQAHHVSSSATITVTGSPYTALTFYKQLHTGSHGRGAALSLGDLYVVIASCHNDVTPTTTINAAGSAYDMGLFVGSQGGGENQASYFRMTNGFDYIKIMCAAGCVKARFASGGTVRFDKVYDNRTGGTRTISRLTTKPTQIEYGTTALSAVRSGAVGVSGDDVNEFRSDPKGTENEAEEGLRLWWHNMPTVGSANEMLFFSRNYDVASGVFSIEKPSPDIDHDHVGISSKDYSLFKLYYLTQAPDGAGHDLFNQPSLLRIHSSVDLDLGGGHTFSSNTTIGWTIGYTDILPNASTGGTDASPTKWRKEILDSQRADSWPHFIASVLGDVLSQTDTTDLRVVVPISDVGPQDIGDAYTLETGTFADWMNGQTYMDGVELTGLFALSAEFNLQADTATVDFHRLPPP